MRERKPIETAVLAEEKKRALTLVQKTIKERQSPAGTLGLPRLLDERRMQYAIPDGAFRTQALFDRIYVWQIPDWEGDTFGDTLIHMPELSKAKAVESAPRGIIVSAGMLARDVLRTNGVDVGHIVRFIRLAPWRERVDTVLGAEQHSLILRSGDLTGSEDLRAELRVDPDAIRWNPETREHEYHGTVRSDPDQPDDY